MGFFSTFYKPQKYKRFHYEPLYYDAKKEEREKRIRRIKQELNIDDESEYVSNIKGAFRKHYEANAKIKHRANVRLIIIFAALLLLAYLLIFS